MCIRDRVEVGLGVEVTRAVLELLRVEVFLLARGQRLMFEAVSYTHLRAHETVLDLVCRLLLEKKKHKRNYPRLR